MSSCVQVEQFVGERSKRAATPADTGCLLIDNSVPPTLDVIPTGERFDQRSVKPKDSFALAFDDCVNQVVLAGEVVIELRLARPGRAADFVEAHAGDTTFVDEIGGRLDDAPASVASFARRGNRFPSVGQGHDTSIAYLLDLTVHFSLVSEWTEQSIRPTEEANVAITNPLPSLQSQLDAISANIPDAIGSRIAAGAGDIAASGTARGLEVGVRAPGFALPDALGNPVTLPHLLSDGPVVVTFYRGEWCPYCNLQLRALQAALPEFRDLGASLVAISPQAPDHSLSLTEKHALDFPVLSDADQEVIRAYHVQFTLAGDLEDLQVNVWHNDPREQNANHTRALPVPATFVIDRDGIVRAAFISADWRVRVEPAEIATALRALIITPAS